MGPKLAWCITGVTAVFVVADVLITAQYLSLTSEAAVAVHGFPFVPGAVLGSAIMGALVITRDRHQIIGWLLVGLGTAGALSIVLEAYAVWVLDHNGPGSHAFAGIAGWVSSLVGGQLAVTGMVFLYLLVPDGRFLSPRWRFAAVIAVAGEVLIVVGLATLDPLTYDLTAQRAAGGAASRQLLNTVGFVMIVAGLLAALVSMILRLRRSSGVERQQLRVVALSAAGICGGAIWLLTAEALVGGPQSWVTILPLFISYLMFPVLLAVAVLRYRLYDVDVIVNRTLVVALGTAFAGVGYVALVVVVSNVAGSRTSSYWYSLVTTALVALAFQPLRRTVVALANRMAFGSRAQPYEALAAFSRRLSTTPSLETVLGLVADAAGRAVSAHGATASLDVSGLPRSSAFWGSDRPDTVHEHGVPVVQGGVTLGSIEVSILPGRPLRPSDLRLLRVIADQTAVAFHNVAMEAQLNRHVSALDLATRELASSRARIVEADDAARRSLSAGISRDVLPHLAGVIDQLGRPRSGISASTQGIQDMVGGVNAALGALRESTHGVYPAQLARSGLEPSLRSYLRRRGPGTSLEIAPDAAGMRFAPRVEAAVYFAVTHAVGSSAGRGAVILGVTEHNVHCTIREAVPDAADLQGIRDRVEAMGGALYLTDGSLRLRIPLTPTSATALPLVDVDLVGGQTSASPHPHRHPQ